MTARSKLSGVLAATVALVVCAAGGAWAQAIIYVQPQYVQPEPLYPYAAQPQYAYPQPRYAAPAYPQSYPQAYPYARTRPAARAQSKTDPALVEELRKGRHAPRKKAATAVTPPVKIDKTVVVREKPVVRNHIRVVDDPPIVVRREIDESQLPVAPAVPAIRPEPAGGRVIHAEAEVTILGPDRMSIRLYRKSDGRDANAKALPNKTRAMKTTKSGKSEPET
jgi:hypothetical protein